MEASRQPKDKNYNLNVETLKSYAQDAEQEGDQEVVSSLTRSSRTTGGCPVGQGDARAPPADLQSALRVVSERSKSTSERAGAGVPALLCTAASTGPLKTTDGLLSATAQLPDQHSAAEDHHGDRSEGSGQKYIGTAGLRQVLLPGGGSGLPGLGRPDHAGDDPAAGLA
jgi:hypothetical protein